MNEIHSTCIIDENVTIGNGNKILPFTIIYGPCKIGNNNIIGPNVVIGTPGEDSKDPRYDDSNSCIEIGDNNIIREFTVVQKPCIHNITKIGNNVFLMHGVHIPHDAIIHDNVVITPMCIVGGITTILEGANIGIGTSIHQNTVVGQFSMVAMGSTITKNVKPFSICIPGKPAKVNTYALKKFKLMQYEEEINSYVLQNKNPESKIIKTYIDYFNKLHISSERKIY